VGPAAPEVYKKKGFISTFLLFDLFEVKVIGYRADNAKVKEGFIRPSTERVLTMTDPISNQMSRLTTPAGPTRTAADKADKSDKKAAVASSAGDTKAAERKAVESDSLELSNVSQRVNSQPEFDRSKVEAIKQSLRNGSYPLNPRRIAESFVALEQMITG
jgi:negative regulator of flagellin synthesis FlgM